MKQWEEERYREREELAKQEAIAEQIITEVIAHIEIAPGIEQVWNCNTGKYEDVIVNPDIPHLPEPTQEVLFWEVLLNSIENHKESDLSMFYYSLIFDAINERLIRIKR